MLFVSRISVSRCPCVESLQTDEVLRPTSTRRLTNELETGRYNKGRIGSTLGPTGEGLEGRLCLPLSTLIRETSLYGFGCSQKFKGSIRSKTSSGYTD